MPSVDYLIIGGGIAGTTAAETLREKDAHAKIAILEDEAHVLYSRVAIPKYLKGDIQRQALFLRRIEDYQKKSINFYPSTSVAKIDSRRHEVFTETGLPDGKAGNLPAGEAGIFSYKKLLVASGGKPKALPPLNPLLVKGGKGEVLRMHTLEDADAIKEAIENAKTREVLVIGESFIALEFLHIFNLKGFRVHALAQGDIWGKARFGKFGGEIVEENFKKHGIVIHKNDEKINAPIIGVGIGLMRNLDFLAGLEVGPPAGGGVLTDEFLQTADPDIYAAGDVAEFFDAVAGRRRTVGNWTNSFLQGRAAAINMAGGASIFKNVSAYNISKVGMGLAFIGDIEDYDDTYEIASPADGGASQDKFLRALFKGGKLKGAVLINRFNDKVLLSQLIENGITKNELEKAFS